LASSTRDALRAALIDGRNSDGGWGYGRGKASRLEPTALALVALDAAGERVDASVLRRWPRSGALLVDPPSGQVNIAHNAIAAVAAQVPSLGIADLAEDVVDALVALRGVKLQPSPAFKQDNALQGWPWLDGTFSWVEPTAWALLAVKRSTVVPARAGVAGRVDQAERLLANRACVHGGWNYGNAIVFGNELFAYVPTTALALLAMQDKAAEPTVARSLTWLRDHRLAERSGLALALTRIALALHRVAADDVERALDEAWSATGFLGNLMAVALALYATAGADRGYAAFQL
jgi:hypothetical protein